MNTTLIPPADDEVVNQLLKREYWCFISYRHADNKESGRQWATWLHQALETYEVPADLVGTKNERGDTIPERIFPVFRDEEELPADAELSRPIESALRRSRFLIVLCSPQSVLSRWVADEILRFKQLGKQDRILAAIIKGHPNASDDPAKPGAHTECFPIPLRFGIGPDGQLSAVRTEPIAADFRLQDGNEGWTSPAAYREALLASGLQDKQASDRVHTYARHQNLMMLKIAAGVLGVPLGLLTQRDKLYQLEKQKQRTRVLRRWLALAATLLIAAAVAGFLAYKNGVEASAQRDIAEARKEEAEGQRNQAIKRKEEADELRVKAVSNEQLAKNREQQAKEALSQSDYFKADALVTAQKRPEALAYLARAIRSDTANLGAGQRALLLLQQGIWYLPSPLPTMDRFEPITACITTDNSILILAKSIRRENNTSLNSALAVFDSKGQMISPHISISPEFEEHAFASELIDEGQTISLKVNDKMHYWDARSGLTRRHEEDSLNNTARTGEIAKQVGLLATSRWGLTELSDLVACSTSGKFFAGLLRNSDILLFNTDSGDHVVCRVSDVVCSGLSFSPDERTITIAHDDTSEFSDGRGSVEILPFKVLPSGEFHIQLYRKAVIDGRTSAVTWMPDGLHFLRNGMFISDINGRTYSALLPRPKHQFTGQHRISNDGRLIVADGLWKRVGCPPFPMQVGDETTKFDAQSKLSADDSGIPRDESGVALLLDKASAKPVRLEGSEKMGAIFVLSPSIVIGFGGVDEVVLWDLKSGKIRHKYTAPKHKRLLTVSHGFAVGYADPKTIVVWNAETGKIAATFPTELNDRYSQPNAVINPNGDRLYINHEGHFEVWDLSNFQIVAKNDLESSHNVYVDTNMSPMGTFFTTAHQHAESEETHERLWDARTLLPLSDRIDDKMLLGGDGHGDSVGTTSFVLNGDVFFKASRDGAGYVSQETNEHTLYLQLTVPETTPVPLWLADLVEAIGGYRLDNEAISEIAALERQAAVESVRRIVRTNEKKELWSRCINWWLDDGPDRRISATSDKRVADVVAGRLSLTSIPVLTATSVAVSEDARVFQRLATLHSDQTTPDLISAEVCLRRALQLQPGDETVVLKSIPSQEHLSVQATLAAPPAAQSPQLAEELFQQGELLRKGVGIPRDPTQAMTFYKRAASIGHDRALHRIGVLYATGDGVAKSDTEAVRWYMLAAQNGLAEAQFDLGVRYILGKGVEKNEPSGIQWYRKAAAQGYKEAVDQLRVRGLGP